MKHFKLIILILLIPILGSSEEVPFFKGSIASVKTKAKVEGKLYILDFYAKWCLPCKFMEENTYSDPRVLEYFKRSYIPVKVDIDDFDGYALKEQFNVSVLPTIMIFDANGVLIERYEETMPPSQFLEILEKFEHRKGTPTPVLPQAYDGGIDVGGVPSITQPTMEQPVTTPTPTYTPSAPVIQPSYEEEVIEENTTTYTDNPIDADLTPVNENLYEFSSHRPSYQGWGVQVGVYAQYANVLREVERFQNMFQEPIMVNISNYKDRTVYRLLIGNFKSEVDAQSFKTTVKDGGLSDAFVKDLKKLN